MDNNEINTPFLSDLAGTENVSDWKREAVEERIAACESRLAAAEKEIQNLRATRFKLNELLNSTSLIMTSLPLDILTEIFTVICEKSSASFDYGSRPEQFLIGAVCRAWRQIAWSTPKLWTCVYIAFSQDRYPAQEGLLREWLGRTANCPLRLYLSVSYSLVLQWEPPRDLFRMLLKTCHQWTSFIYTFPSISFPAALRHGKNVTFPLLDTLLVQGGEERAWNQENVWNFNSTPRLRNLNVRCHRRFSLDLSWTSLTHLSAALELRGCVRLLTLPHNSLEKLSLSVLSSRDRLTNPDKPQYHPLRLTSLVIDGGATMVGSLLRLMTLPALKELDLDLYDDSRNYPWIGVVTEMAQRSTFPLTNLTLKQATTFDENRILDMLSEMPSIESLELDCSDLWTFSLSDHTINRLDPALQQRDYNNTGFLPSLTFFKYRGNISFSLGSLEKMIRKRLLDVRLDSPNTADIANAFHIDIAYRNILWHQNRNPNDLRNFYMVVTSLYSEGLTFKLEWVEDDDDD